MDQHGSHGPKVNRVFIQPPLELNGKAHLVSGARPPKAGPKIKILQVKAGKSIQGVICSPSVWGVHTHWNPKMGIKGRSEECTANWDKEGNPTEWCSGCDKGLSLRWKGYIHIWQPDEKVEAFIEITPGAFEKLLNQAPEDRSLRGLEVYVMRTPGGDQGRLKIKLNLWTGSVATLPEPRDPRPILAILWLWNR